MSPKRTPLDLRTADIEDHALRLENATRAICLLVNQLAVASPDDTRFRALQWAAGSAEMEAQGLTGQLELLKAELPAAVQS